MDDVNINKICIEEVELDGEEKEWIKLNWTSKSSDNDESFQSLEIQKMINTDDDEIAQTKDCDNKVSLFTNAEPEDISDGISVITESDTDVVNTNFFRISYSKSFKAPQILEVPIDRQKSIWIALMACVLGIIIGLALSHFFTSPKISSVSDGADADSLRTASHNIVNTCKELTDVKTMLSEIKAHIPADKKIMKHFLTQFSEITDSSSNTINSKPITKESFNSTLHPLDQLQRALHVISSLVFTYDNSSLKNEINKTLDIVNSTKVFYDTLMLFTNNTQDEFNPIVLNFLQHTSDKMHITSKLLLSNLIEKVSKVTSKVYNKYAKERHGLYKKLCYLKSTMPNDKFLKQLVENNQLFKDYDKSCFLNHRSKNLDGRAVTKDKGNTKIKEQIIKTNNTVLHTKYNKKYDNHVIHNNNRENSLKNKRNKRQNVARSTMKFLQNMGRKIHNTSQLLISEVVKNISDLRRQLSKKLRHLENILPNNDEFLKQLLEDDNKGDNKGNNKDSDKCEGKDDYVQTSKNNFDNILMQLKNMCPLSTNYCPKFNINMSTFDTISSHKTKNYKHKKHTNSKKTVDYENSVKIWPAEGESRSRKKDYFKSNDSTKKVIHDKVNEGKNISSQNKLKNHVSEHTVNYHKSEHSSHNSHTIKPDNQHYTNTDRRSDNKRSHEYKKRQLDDLNWYFRRAYSRRHARRNAEYMYRQDTRWRDTWFWKNR